MFTHRLIFFSLFRDCVDTSLNRVDTSLNRRYHFVDFLVISYLTPLPAGKLESIIEIISLNPH